MNQLKQMILHRVDPIAGIDEHQITIYDYYETYEDYTYKKAA
jgi:hypothetical protein